MKSINDLAWVKKPFKWKCERNTDNFYSILFCNDTQWAHTLQKPKTTTRTKTTTITSKMEKHKKETLAQISLVFVEHRFRFRQSIRFDSISKTNHSDFSHFLFDNETLPGLKLNNFTAFVCIEMNNKQTLISRTQSTIDILLQEIRRPIKKDLI